MSELITKSGIEIAICIEKQANLCKDKKLPHFAPDNGKCWSCNRNIYQNYDYKLGGRITQGETGEKFITGCPHCNRTYCD